MKYALIIAIQLITLSTAFAAGGEVGNGGDICENRFKVVRDDIMLWIQKGGSQGLRLPNGRTIADYNSTMMEKLMNAQVSCTSNKVIISGAEKTCKNVSYGSGALQIECNAQRFLQTSESDQYVLVHHEYAGLAGFEISTGADSDYRISNQISGYLEDVSVKRLAVHPTSPSFPVRSGHVYVSDQGPFSCAALIEYYPKDEILVKHVVNNPLSGWFCGEPDNFVTYKCTGSKCISINESSHHYGAITLTQSGNFILTDWLNCYHDSQGNLTCPDPKSADGQEYWTATAYTESPKPTLFGWGKYGSCSNPPTKEERVRLINDAAQIPLANCAIYSSRCEIDQALSRLDDIDRSDGKCRGVAFVRAK